MHCTACNCPYPLPYPFSAPLLSTSLTCFAQHIDTALANAEANTTLTRSISGPALHTYLGVLLTSVDESDCARMRPGCNVNQRPHIFARRPMEATWRSCRLCGKCSHACYIEWIACNANERSKGVNAYVDRMRGNHPLAAHRGAIRALQVCSEHHPRSARRQQREFPGTEQPGTPGVLAAKLLAQ